MKQKKNAPQVAVVSTDLTLSNALSAFRGLLVIPLLLFLLDSPAQNRGSVLLISLVAYLSDLADGWVARHFHQESNLGRIIDPLADKIFIGGGVIALLIAGSIPLWFGVVIVARDLVIFSGGMYLRMHSGVLVQSTMAGKMTVVSIGVVLIASLFPDALPSVWFKLLELTALGFITYSLVSYGERFFRILKKQS